MRHKTKQIKTEKKQKVYFMPESIEYAHRKCEKVIHTKNKTDLQKTRIHSIMFWTGEMLLKFIIQNFFHVGGVS